MIEESVELFSSAVRTSGVKPDVLISAGSSGGGRLGDQGRIRQVLTNVLGNAVKFTSAGEVVLSVKATDVGSDETMLEFSVRDTGIGISAGKLHEIFDVFSQADGSNTRRYGGTGLGLSIARQLCEMMGGAIIAESTPGVGSCSASRWGGKAAEDTLEDAGGLVRAEGEEPLWLSMPIRRPGNIEKHLVHVGVRPRLVTNADERW